MPNLQRAAIHQMKRGRRKERKDGRKKDEFVGKNKLCVIKAKNKFFLP